MISCVFEDGNPTSLRHVVVDVILVKETRILLVKRAEKLTEGGKWAIPGGFVDRNETTQATAAREVREETGYGVNNLTLLTIRDNPDRRNEDRQNIAFIFIGEAGEKTGASDWEVSEQKWFDFSELPSEEEMAFDHYEATQLYLKYKKENTPLPILT